MIEDLWDDYETSAKGMYVNFFDFLQKNGYLTLSNNVHKAEELAKNMPTATKKKKTKK